MAFGKTVDSFTFFIGILFHDYFNFSTLPIFITITISIYEEKDGWWPSERGRICWQQQRPHCLCTTWQIVIIVIIFVRMRVLIMMTMSLARVDAKVSSSSRGTPWTPNTCCAPTWWWVRRKDHSRWLINTKVGSCFCILDARLAEAIFCNFMFHCPNEPGAAAAVSKNSLYSR